MRILLRRPGHGHYHTCVGISRSPFDHPILGIEENHLGIDRDGQVMTTRRPRERANRRVLPLIHQHLPTRIPDQQLLIVPAAGQHRPIEGPGQRAYRLLMLLKDELRLRVRGHKRLCRCALRGRPRRHSRTSLGHLHHPIESLIAREHTQPRVGQTDTGQAQSRAARHQKRTSRPYPPAAPYWQRRWRQGRRRQRGQRLAPHAYKSAGVSNGLVRVKRRRLPGYLLRGRYWHRLSFRHV